MTMAPSASTPGACRGSRTVPVAMCLDSSLSVKPRGICSKCGDAFAVLGDGTIRAHMADRGRLIPQRSNKTGTVQKIGSPGQGPGRKVPSRDIRSGVSASVDCNGVDRQLGKVIDAHNRFRSTGRDPQCRECSEVGTVIVIPNIDHRRKKPWPQTYWLCDEHAEADKGQLKVPGSETT